MDYGRYKYELTKKKQEAKKKQTTFQLKEIKVRPKTGEHDLQTKINHIRKFIERKDKVKVTVVLMGRENKKYHNCKILVESIIKKNHKSPNS